MDVSHHIKQLLYFHDCVIVPGFGGFLTNYQSASFNNSNEVFSPPAKKVVFNKSLHKNDGLLLNQIAQAEGLSFDEANREVSKFVFEIDERLKEHNIVQLPMLGKFYYDMEHNLQFLPDRQANFLSDAYGLTEIQTIRISQLEKEAPVERQLVREDHLKVVHLAKTATKTTGKIRSGRAIIRSAKVFQGLNAYVAVMMILAGALVFQWFWYDNTMGDVKMHFSDLTSPVVEKVIEWKNKLVGEKSEPVKEEDQAEVTSEEIEPVIIDETKDDLVIPDPDEVIEETVTEDVEDVEPIIESIPQIYIIVGAFGVEQNAINLHKKVISLNFRSIILDPHRGLHRVAIGGFNSSAEANSYIGEVRAAINADAWILE